MKGLSPSITLVGISPGSCGCWHDGFTDFGSSLYLVHNHLCADVKAAVQEDSNVMSKPLDLLS